MLEIGGRTLLSRLVTTLERHVGRIHVVVGYREELVINLCASLHRNTVIVRNTQYRTTNTVQSMALGAQGLNGKTIFLDGDLIIEPSSLHAFINKAGKHEVLAAITKSRSENPVNVELVDQSEAVETLQIQAFTREPAHPYEWANVVAGPARIMDGAEGYVFERLEEFIPVDASELELREIDTAADLDVARAFVSSMSCKK